LPPFAAGFLDGMAENSWYGTVSFAYQLVTNPQARADFVSAMQAIANDPVGVLGAVFSQYKDTFSRITSGKATNDDWNTLGSLIGENLSSISSGGAGFLAAVGKLVKKVVRPDINKLKSSTLKIVEKTVEETSDQVKKSANGVIHNSGKKHGSRSHYDVILVNVRKFWNNGETVFVNRALNTALGKKIPIVGGWRPDVLSIDKNGLVSIVEVLSPKQTLKDMQEKVSKMTKALENLGYKVQSTILDGKGKKLQ
jgi:hypothetical protein